MEKTEQPTEHRRNEARNKGTVAKSQELAGAAACIAGAATIAWHIPTTAPSLLNWLQSAIPRYTTIASTLHSPNSLTHTLHHELTTLADFLLWPLISVIFFSAIASFLTLFAQVGVLFVPSLIAPKMERIHIGKNLQNLFNRHKLIELLKNITKLVTAVLLTWLLSSTLLPELLTAPFSQAGHPSSPHTNLFKHEGPTHAIHQQIQQLNDHVFLVSASFGALLLLFGILDLIAVRHRTTTQLKMSKHELIQEYKQLNTPGEVKARQHEIHQEIMNDAGIDSIKESDVIVVNPTQISVAIVYREGRDRTPIILAKGRGEKARAIRQAARLHGIPIVRNIPLARSLIHHPLHIDLPSDLFEPLADTLSYVYSLRNNETHTPPSHNSSPSHNTAPSHPSHSSHERPL